MAKGRSAQLIVKPSAQSVMAGATAVAKGAGPAPVHLWNPAFCGDIDMRIARDGTWFHEGTPIGRAPLVRLFANILKREGDAYFLVTPVEKVGLRVDDVPFVAVDFDVEGAGDAQTVTFVTNVGDRASAGPDHPLRVVRDAATGGPSPYVMIRAGLDARIDRKSFYRLVELCHDEPHDGALWFGLRSGGSFFPMIPAAELAAARAP